MPATCFFTRKLTLPYQANGKTVDRLPRDGILRTLYIRLTGQLTLTAANNTRANTVLGDEWNVIQRIEIIANNNTIRSLPGAALWPLARYYYGNRPYLATQLGDAVSNGAATGSVNPFFDSVIAIPFWLPRSVKPIETALPAHLLNDLRVEVTWGSHTSINSQATGFTINPTVELSSYYSTPIDGQFKMTRVYPIQTQVAAANQRQRINIPTGPQYRGFLIQCLNTAGTIEQAWNGGPWSNASNQTVTSGADNQGIKNFRLTSGDVNFIDLPEPVIWQESFLHNDILFPQNYGFNKAAAAVSTGLGTNIATSNQSFADVPDRISDKADSRAWYMIDLVRDGYNTEMLDTFGWTELFFELDVRAAQLINVFPLEITPVRGG
jgi:hypothetical protein